MIPCLDKGNLSIVLYLDKDSHMFKDNLNTFMMKWLLAQKK